MGKIDAEGLDWFILSLGTDGIDGPTDAAGAWADASTAGCARALRLDPAAYLDDNDSYSFFKQTGYLIVTTDRDERHGPAPFPAPRGLITCRRRRGPTS